MSPTLRSLACLTTLCAGLAQAEDALPPLRPVASVDGRVAAMAVNGDAVYLGGDFNYCGYRVPHLGLVDATTGVPAGNFPFTNGEVRKVISDGAGGFWVAGSFTEIGAGDAATAVSNLAHVQPAGAGWSVAAVPLTFNEAIYSLWLQGTTLYLGGRFTSVSGYGRNHAAAIQVATNQLLPWNPNVDGTVNDVTVAGSPGSERVWLTGVFNVVDGRTRGNLAAVDLTTGKVSLQNSSAWQGGYGGLQLAAAGRDLYLAGTGDSQNATSGFKHSGLGLFDAVGASANRPEEFFPVTDQPVYAVIADGAGGWYVGGAFTQIGGEARNRLARIRADYSIDPAFNPGADGAVRTLVLHGGALYAGGAFGQIGGLARARVARLDPASGTADSAWRADVTEPGQPGAGLVRRLLVAQGSLWTCGQFSRIGGRFRANLARLDLASGAVAEWRLGYRYAYGSSEATGLASVGATLYAAGQSSSSRTMGYFTPGLAAFDGSGASSSAFPGTNGEVRAVVDDGSGGWYLGGTFSAIGATDFSGVAHVLADGSVDANWHPQANGAVNALCRVGAILYVGGDFTQIGGAGRNRMAAIDCAPGVTYGAARGWNPDANGVVNALASDGNTVWAAGSFSVIGGQSRAGLAGLAADTASASAWNPAPSSVVSALWLDAVAQRLYVGGGFATIAGASRAGLAAFDSAAGTLDPWAPAANGAVRVIQALGSDLLVGGAFTQVAGVARARVGQVSRAGGAVAVRAWAPVVNDSEVRSALVQGGAVYLGGSFTQVAGVARPFLVKVDAGTAAVDATWLPSLDAPVAALGGGSLVVAGGSFAITRAQVFDGVRAMDMTSETLLAGFTPSFDGNQVEDLTTSAGGRLFAAGDFALVNGSGHRGVVELDPATGVPTAFNPLLDGSAISVQVIGNSLYLGSAPRLPWYPYDSLQGFRTSAGGQVRRGAAAIDLATGAATAYDPHTDKVVWAFASDGSGSRILAGGEFAWTGWQYRSGLMKVDADTGRVVPSWVADCYQAYACQLANGVLYVGGPFNSINEVSRQHLAAVDTVTGALSAWAPAPNRYVFDIASSGTDILISGNFDQIGATAARGGIASINSVTGVVAAWNPGLRSSTITDMAINYPAWTILPTAGGVVLGGGFTWMGGGWRSHLAAVRLSDGAPLPWAPMVQNPYLHGTNPPYGAPVHALAVAGSGITETVYVGGAFGRITNQAANNLAAVTGVQAPSPGTVANWTAPINDRVRSLCLDGPTLYVGGQFTNACGVPRNRLAAVNAISAVLASASTLGATSVSIATTGPATLAAGTAFTINNITYTATATATWSDGALTQTVAFTPALSAADPLGTTVGLPVTCTAWNPDADGIVHVLLRDGTQLYAGGDFTQIGGQARGHLAAFTVADGALTSWDAAIDGSVRSLLAWDGVLYAGGAFGSVSGVARAHLVAFAADRSLLPWNPAPNQLVSALAPGRSDVLVGGYFSTIGQQAQTGLAGVSRTTATAFGTWSDIVKQSGEGYPVESLIRLSDRILVGGKIDRIDQRLPHSGFAILPLRPLPDPGDFSGDKVVNADDLNLVLSHFGFRITDAGWDSRADGNSDGVVNVDDLALVVGNFGRTY